MLLGRQVLLLMRQLSQTTADAETGITRFDDIVDITELCRLIRIGKLLGVFFLLFGQELLDITALLLDLPGLLSAENGYGT